MDKLIISVSVIFMTCLASEILAIRWKDCGSVLAKPKGVIVSGCENLDTCLLRKGANSTVGIDFVPTSNESSLKMMVYGHIAGVDIPFPLNNPDACKDSNITCPVVQGQSYSYRNVIFVRNEYPSLSLTVKLKLVNAKADVLVCVIIPVKITSVSSQSNPNSVLRFVPRQ